MYSSLTCFSQTHHFLHPDNVNTDKLHELACLHLIIEDFNPTLSFLLHIFPLSSRSISGGTNVVSDPCSQTAINYLVSNTQSVAVASPGYPFSSLLVPLPFVHQLPHTISPQPPFTGADTSAALPLIVNPLLPSRGATTPLCTCTAVTSTFNCNLRQEPYGKKCHLILSDIVVIFLYRHHEIGAFRYLSMVGNA